MDITVSTNFADQFIQAINAICQKLGIALDWSSETIVPKLEDLVGRFAQYRISLYWSLVGLTGFLFLTSIVFWVGVNKKVSGHYSTLPEGSAIIMVFLGLVFFIMSVFAIVHITRAMNLPELELLEWIKSYGGNR